MRPAHLKGFLMAGAKIRRWTERSGFHPMASVWCAEQKQIGCQRLRYREAQVC